MILDPWTTLPSSPLATTAVPAPKTCATTRAALILEDIVRALDSAPTSKETGQGVVYSRPSADRYGQRRAEAAASSARRNGPSTVMAKL